MLSSSLLSVDSPPSHRFDHNTLISCIHMPPVHVHGMSLNGNHFFCTCKDTKVTSTLWFFSIIYGYFSICHMQASFNSNISELHLTWICWVDLIRYTYSFYIYMPNELRSTWDYFLLWHHASSVMHWQHKVYLGVLNSNFCLAIKIR